MWPTTKGEPAVKTGNSWKQTTCEGNARIPPSYVFSGQASKSFWLLWPNPPYLQQINSLHWTTKLPNAQVLHHDSALAVLVRLHVSCNSASERWVKCNWWSRHRVNLTGISVLSTPENVQRLPQSEWNCDDRCVSHAMTYWWLCRHYPTQYG